MDLNKKKFEVFTRGDLPSIQHVVNILATFSQWSGLNANLEKAEAYLGGVPSNIKAQILAVVGIHEGRFPFRYLGLPIHSSRLTTEMFDGLLLKIQMLAGQFSTKHLSYAGRIQVLNSAVFGLCNFWCTGLLLPKQIIKGIVKLSRDLFWGKNDGTKRIIFKSWQSICLPWEEGGFQIKDIGKWNQPIMLKWLWCLDHGRGAIWNLWTSNYLTNQCTIWTLTAKEYYSDCIRVIIQVRNECISKFGSLQAAEGVLEQCLVNHKFSLRKAYDALRESSIVMPVYKAISRGTMVPRHRVTLMMVVQQKLPTVDQLMGKGRILINRCCLCKQDSECASHMFFSCDYYTDVLSSIKHWINLNTPCTDLESLLLWANSRHKKKHWKHKWVRCSLGCLVSSLWTERNLRIFEGKERSTNQLVKEIQLIVSTLILNTVNDAVYTEVVVALNERPVFVD
ncbi:uncharacterized protein LOC141631294 [Silene latifolia]|uniref:uncharacterized protein LOC141631294 n=1 Tax=Silene latifolia TaxID=37657 RepID=UPI003D776605